MSDALQWLLLNLGFLAILSFYSMMEMACISFNKVRLQYYVSQKNRRAEWLHTLLQNPSRLFGTTLIGVNVAVVVGSECGRRFYEAIGFNPDLAPLTQVVIVVVLGELSPMFAARRYAEHVALLGIPLVYLSAKILSPILWVIEIITRSFSKKSSNIFLSRDELQKILETTDEHSVASDDFTAIVTNIFQLRDKTAEQVMRPLSNFVLLPSSSTVGEMRKQAKSFIPIYHHHVGQIVAIATPRELLRIPDSKRVRDHSKAPWFVTRHMSLLQILRQFRKNHQRVAVVLDDGGAAVGLITFDDAKEEIFGKELELKMPSKVNLHLIERTFPADMRIKDFNLQFQAHLSEEEDTFSDLMTETLGHIPEQGETIYIEPFELTANSSSLLELKTITVRTRA